VEQIPESLVGFDHIVEGVERQVIIDDFFFILVLLVGEFEVDIDDFLYFLAALLELEVVFVDVVDHHAIEGVVFVGFEGVFVEDGLGVLPDVLLDILSITKMVRLLACGSVGRGSPGSHCCRPAPQGWRSFRSSLRSGTLFRTVIELCCRFGGEPHLIHTTYTLHLLRFLLLLLLAQLLRHFASLGVAEAFFPLAFLLVLVALEDAREILGIEIQVDLYATI